ncbi:MAG: hypothetical protein KAT68_09310 [Bacteroidales bacterium]|nr:hypothetical protein [Bacteroidales bacterium]
MKIQVRILIVSIILFLVKLICLITHFFWTNIGESINSIGYIIYHLDRIIVFLMTVIIIFLLVKKILKISLISIFTILILVFTMIMSEIGIKNLNENKSPVILEAHYHREQDEGLTIKFRKDKTFEIFKTGGFLPKYDFFYGIYEFKEDSIFIKYDIDSRIDTMIIVDSIGWRSEIGYLKYLNIKNTREGYLPYGIIKNKLKD